MILYQSDYLLYYFERNLQLTSLATPQITILCCHDFVPQFGTGTGSKHDPLTEILIQ